MSKHWQPGGKKVAVRPSRIRRDPVRLVNVPRLDEASIQKAEINSRSRQMWGGVAGVIGLALALTVLIVGIGAATLSSYDPVAAAAQSKRFGQCYNTDGPNCVVDANTIYVGGAKYEVAGFAGPEIQDAGCAAERDRGIDAAVKMADLLNAGTVTVGPAVRDQDGRETHKIEVNGRDVAAVMLDTGLAHRGGTDRADWCRAG